MDFDELGKSAKSLLKNKKFQIAMIVVGMVAIILWIIRQNRTTTTTTETYDYYDGNQAIGYGGYGYPYAGGSADADYDWIYDRFDSMAELIESGNTAQDEKWEGLFDSLNERLDALADRDSGGGSNHVTGSSHGSSASKIDEQAIIDAMEQNSSAWWDVTDAAGRDYLHAENSYLGGLIGAVYNPENGKWYKDGLPLYNIDKGNPMSYVTTTGKKTASSNKVTYVNNIDYQAAINEAIRTGQSADVINQLNDARNAKIAATGNSKANVSFDQNTDYMALINQAKAAGASQSVIDNLTAQREAKMAAAAGKITVNGKSTAAGGGKRVNMTK